MAISKRKSVQITGGGIIGMSIAWRLAQYAIDVTVFDKGKIGAEASWAAAGMLAPGGEYTVRSHWSDLAIESLVLYPAFVRELEEESGIAIDFRICGAVERALPNEHAEQAQAMGIRSERLSDREVFFPDDAVVNPRDIMAALRVACERRGVDLRENQVAGDIKGPWVIAAGAWSSSIGAPVRLEPSFPVRGHLVSYHSIGPPGSILRSGPTYILDRANGVTIAGSSVERVGFDRVVDPAIVADIDRRAHELIPNLGEPQSAWIGFRPATESLEPEIGQIPGTEIFCAYGHYRNGILLAPVTARIIAEQVRNA
jgi:glycine oxidase